MEKLHHPNLVQLFEVIENFSKIHLVFEYASGGELYQKISNQGKLIEPVAKSLFAQIISAIDHMVSIIAYRYIILIHHSPHSTFLLSLSLSLSLAGSVYLKLVLLYTCNSFLSWNSSFSYYCHIPVRLSRIYCYFISQLSQL